MSEHKRGEERIIRVTEIDGERTSWADEGELVRCADCVNWGEMAPEGSQGWCPIVRKCTRAGDWCCWGAKGESDEG